ncbi:MAG: FAD-dependent oxidoreductase [Acidobacteria bacterium]|nr:FAD-dependent oxidoreductase [Acidobacteriota bacterium]
MKGLPAEKAENKVVIIGGGFAGLAAAVELTERGLPVLLLERRSFLGGRAYSFTDKTTGDVIDNGQHLMMGCYHHTLNFLRKIGSADKLRFQSDSQVDFLEIAGGLSRQSTFKCPSLPAPLHLVAGLMRLQTLSWTDKFKALNVGLALLRLNGNWASLADITVREWLTGLGQSENIQHKFWDLMALATLNELPEIASADMFARVLEQGFMHSREDSTMVISKVGLSDLYTTNARKFIESRGGRVCLNADVTGLEFADNRVSRIVLRSGEEIIPDALISAVPYFVLRRILPAEVVESSDSLRHLNQFNSAPIVSINLWYQNPVMDSEFVGLIDSRIEWVFNKNAIIGNPQKRPQHLALVISGAHQVASLSKEEIIEIGVDEINRFFPSARHQQPIHAYVIKEHDATLSHVAGLAKLRPGHATDFENLYLAGDWTDTGLPATIESAVQSGHQCARLILQYL